MPLERHTIWNKASSRAEGTAGARALAQEPGCLAARNVGKEEIAKGMEGGVFWKDLAPGCQGGLSWIGWPGLGRAFCLSQSTSHQWDSGGERDLTQMCT